MQPGLALEPPRPSVDTQFFPRTAGNAEWLGYAEHFRAVTR
jgi:hypothetical protein